MNTSSPERRANTSSEPVDVLLAAITLIAIVFFFSFMLIYGAPSIALRDFEAVRQLILDYAFGAIISQALSNALLFVLQISINLTAIHIVARMLGGRADAMRFFHKLFSFYIVLFILLFVAVGLIVLGVLSDSQETFESLSAIGSLLLLATVLIFPFGEALVVARAHYFGVFKGCASVLLGLIVIVLALIVLSTLFGDLIILGG